MNSVSVWLILYSDCLKLMLVLWIVVGYDSVGQIIICVFGLKFLVNSQVLSISSMMLIVNVLCGCFVSVSVMSVIVCSVNFVIVI